MKFRVGKNRYNRILGFEGVLPDIINELNVEESFIIENIRSLWIDIVGNIIATHSIPDRIFKKTLFISVDHSVYSNEIMMMKDSIIEKISEEISSNLIVNIRACLLYTSDAADEEDSGNLGSCSIIE